MNHSMKCPKNAAEEEGNGFSDLINSIGACFISKTWYVLWDKADEREKVFNFLVIWYVFKQLMKRKLGTKRWENIFKST